MYESRKEPVHAPAPAPESPGEVHQEFPVFDYLQLLWYRRKLILAITTFVAVVGWIHVNQIRSLYTASATLMVGVPQSNVVDIESVVAKSHNADQVLTEMEVLRSRVLGRKVVKNLGLVNYPEFNPSLREPDESPFDMLRYLNPVNWIPQSWKQALAEAAGRETRTDPPVPPTEAELAALQIETATSILISKIEMEEVMYANVIRLGFTSWTPDMAARIANYLPEAYMLDQLESKFEATEKANAWLTDQLSALESKVTESERAVEIFREEYGLDSVSGDGLLDRQLSELNSQLIVARAELADIEARLEQVRQLNVGNYNRVAALNEVLASSMIQQLRSQELDVLSRKSELTLEFGPKHPRMLQVEAELSEIRERIDLEIANVTTGLKNEADFARTRIAKLESGIGEVQGEFSEINKEAVKLRALEREAAANRALFETFLTRFKETSTTQGMETSDARVLSEAQVPVGASYPNRKKMFLAFLLAGFAGSCGLVIGLSFLNPGLRGPEEVQKALDAFVIGVIPKITGKSPLYEHVIDDPQSRAVEALHSLKFSLALSNPDIQVKSVLVTSSVPEEGKTSLAIALARAEARSGKRVILVDGDLRRGSVISKLGLEHGHLGLSDMVVAADAEIEDFILRDEKGQMDVMPRGTAEYINAGDIFSSMRMTAIIEDLKSRYDLVIVDSSPVMAVADSRIIGQLMDKTLFVVRWDKTPQKAARAALDLLRLYGTDVAGIVLQQVDLSRYGRLGHGDSGYYYHYGRYDKYYSGS